ncbi:hypothetical protein E5D57_011009 [Metarhizium anisopliae]|nr:hypothetical protein E5D57_011009 [Metarhizium anisopliae]
MSPMEEMPFSKQCEYYVLYLETLQHRFNRYVMGVGSFVVVASEGQTVADVDKLIEQWKKEAGRDEFRKASIELDVEIKPNYKPPPNWSLWSYDNKKNPADVLTGVEGTISLSDFMRKHGFGYNLVARGQHMFAKDFLKK